MELTTEQAEECSKEVHRQLDKLYDHWVLVYTAKVDGELRTSCLSCSKTPTYAILGLLDTARDDTLKRREIDYRRGDEEVKQD